MHSDKRIVIRNLGIHQAIQKNLRWKQGSICCNKLESDKLGWNMTRSPKSLSFWTYAHNGFNGSDILWTKPHCIFVLKCKKKKQLIYKMYNMGIYEDSREQKFQKRKMIYKTELQTLLHRGIVATQNENIIKVNFTE